MPPRRRLNLFAFSAETIALFGMLIVAALILALLFGSALRFYSPVGNTFASIDITARGLEFTRASLPIICLSGMVAFSTLCLAFLFYLRHPSQIRQRGKLQRLTEKDRGIQEEVNKLATEAGINPPSIEMPPQGLKGTDAQAFGIGRAHTIALDGGFRILRKTRPGLFKALLHHELAHFANKDIGRSYFSDALWRSIRWLLVFPFLLAISGNMISRFISGILNRNLFEFLRYSVPTALTVFIQWGFVLIITGIIWARLLRTREFYADWKAALWGSQNGLRDIFIEESEKKKPKTLFNLWKFHPDVRDRLVVLEYPETLFKLSPTMGFLAGLLLSFIFSGLYFSFAVFLAFAGPILSIRSTTTGLSYWLATGIFWLGFASLILSVIGLIGWLINGVLVPQIQKQAILYLLGRQSGWTQYGKLGMPALILAAGVEIGLFITPFGQLAPNDLSRILIEFFIIFPILACLTWWYLIYIKFIASRLSATQMGRSLSPQRSRFIKTASVIWAFFFFMPGLVLSRFWDFGFPYFIYLNLGWLAFTIALSSIAFVLSWAAMKFFFENQPKRCPHCGNITRHATPAIELCEHCGGVLGEWLFVPESPS